MNIPKADSDLLGLKRKWTFRAHGQQLVVVKNNLEKASHVYMKAFLWALYQPLFPGLVIEQSLGLRYKPDVVAVDRQGVPLFWAEAGQVTLEKLGKLFKRFPGTHFAVAKWASAPQWGLHLERLIGPLKRRAPIDFLIFPKESLSWIDDSGTIGASLEDVLVKRF